MEGTQSLEILASSGQIDMLSDDLGDVDTVLDLIDDVYRNQASAHGSRGSCTPTLHLWGWFA